MKKTWKYFISWAAVRIPVFSIESRTVTQNEKPYNNTELLIPFLSVYIFCSSRSLSMSQVSTVRTSIRQRAACGTAGRKTRRKNKTRRSQRNSQAWWGAFTSLDPVSPPRPCTQPTVTVRQCGLWRWGRTQFSSCCLRGTSRLDWNFTVGHRPRADIGDNSTVIILVALWWWYYPFVW